MASVLQRLFALVVPQGADRHVRYCGIQIICLVMVWFFVQGSGGVTLVDKSHLPSPDELMYLRLLNLGAQCGGGVLGSIAVLVGARIGLGHNPLGASEGIWKNRVPARRLALGCSGALILSLAGCLVCTVASIPIASALLRMAACALVTVLFLEACLVLVGHSMATVLAVFLLVSLCRIVQNLLMLPFSQDLTWTVVSFAVEIILVGAYVATVLRLPPTSSNSRSESSPTAGSAREQSGIASGAPLPANASAAQDSTIPRGTSQKETPPPRGSTAALPPLAVHRARDAVLLRCGRAALLGRRPGHSRTANQLLVPTG